MCRTRFLSCNLLHVFANLRSLCRWATKDGQLCTIADQGSPANRIKKGSRPRSSQNRAWAGHPLGWSKSRAGYRIVDSFLHQMVIEPGIFHIPTPILLTLAPRTCIACAGHRHRLSFVQLPPAIISSGIEVRVHSLSWSSHLSLLCRSVQRDYCSGDQKKSVRNE